MNSQEKAKELINKFIPHTRVFHEVLGWEDYIDSAKQCALIAVDEVLNVVVGIYDYDYEVLNPYWQEVKQEIIKYK